MDRGYCKRPWKVKRDFGNYEMNFHEACLRTVSIAQPSTLNPVHYHWTTASPSQLCKNADVRLIALLLSILILVKMFVKLLL